MDVTSNTASQILTLLGELNYSINSGFNDGWVASGYKRDLFVIKNRINEMYDQCDTFVNEELWEQECLVDVLSKSVD